MHKNAVTLKAQVEFFVKKADKSFGVEIKTADGDHTITKLYGSLNRNVYRQDFSIGDLIDKKGKVTFKKISRKAEKDEKVTKGSGDSLDKLADQLVERIMSKLSKRGRK